MKIIELSEEKLAIEDNIVEVEFQGGTIGKYDLSFNGKNFVLNNKRTTCLANDACGIPTKEAKQEVETSCCSPNSGCC